MQSNLPKLWNEFLHETNYSIESHLFTVETIFEFVRWLENKKDVSLA
jgi:hypothetical protein